MTNYAEKISDLARQEVRRLKGAMGCANCRYAGFETRDRKALVGVDVSDDVGELASAARIKSTCDLFFSNHLLEHVPGPSDAIATARRLLKPGRLFVAITPNGSLGYLDAAADRRASRWCQGVGPDHLWCAPPRRTSLGRIT